MRGKPRFPKTHREVLAANNAADSFYAALAGVEPRAQNVIPPQRQRKSSGGDPRNATDIDAVHSERENMRAIRRALKADPRVASVQRNQSGIVIGANGRRFTIGAVGKLDLTVYLKDGRYVEIEVKSDIGKLREAQARRIERIRASGGIAGVARTAAEALAILP